MQTSSELLNHEQGHFDLAEFLRPMITEKIQTIFNKKTFPTRGKNQEQQKQFAREYSNLLISKEFGKWEKYLLEKQEEYDTQTNYGQLLGKQKEYNLKFQELRI